MKINYADISVELLDRMGDDLTVVNAARVSFARESRELSGGDGRLIRTLADGLNSREREVYSGNLREPDNLRCMREFKREPAHWAPFAHPQISLRCKVPIFMMRQLAKHQAGGVVSEVSRRYVDDEPEFWRPREWRGRGGTNKQGSGEALEDQGFLQSLQENVCRLELHAYRTALEQGACPEQARILLPVATMTEIVWTGSLAFFARVYNHRNGAGAQRDTREVARRLGAIIKPLFPVSWAALTGDE